MLNLPDDLPPDPFQLAILQVLEGVARDDLKHYGMIGYLQFWEIAKAFPEVSPALVRENLNILDAYDCVNRHSIRDRWMIDPSLLG